MKHKIILLILAAFILTAGLSGCIGNSHMNGGGHMDGGSHMYDRDEADIRSVTLAVNGSDVIAMIVTELDFDERLDTENIRVSKIGNIVHVSIYSVEPAVEIGNNVIDVKIGAVSELNDGADYTLIINDENDRDERTVFRFENNTLVYFKRAFVQSVTFEANGNELYAVASIANVGAGTVVDEQNITKTRFDHENEMDMYIPLKVISTSPTGNETITEKVSIGQLNQMADGRYSVEINNRESYFGIRSSALVN